MCLQVSLGNRINKAHPLNTSLFCYRFLTCNDIYTLEFQVSMDVTSVAANKICLYFKVLKPKVSLRTTWFNLLTPNINYSGRTAPLTSKVAFYIFI